MRILAVYRHFWPDSPPYASMLRTITARLVKDGHKVAMLAEKPGYKAGDRVLDVPVCDTVDGVDVRRLARLPLASRSGLIRRAAAVLFPVRTVLHALGQRLRGQRYDVIWTATMPPVINGLGTRIAGRILGAKFVYHFQDIYPELQTFSGNWRKGGALDRVVGRIDRGNAKAAAACIVLSEDMADTVVERGVDRKNIHVINNFMLTAFGDEAATPPELEKPDGTFRVIFAGNIGRFQGLDAFIDAAHILAPEERKIEFLVLGEGAYLQTLKARAEGLPNVRFAGHRPFEEARPVIAGADLGLVSIQPGIYRTAYPSKTLTYLGLGVPVLAVIEPESTLAREVSEHELGFVANGSDGPALAAAIRKAHATRDALPELRRRARTHYEETLSMEAALDRWSALMRDLEAQ